MKELPIPLIEMKEAIEKGKYSSKYNFCRISSVRHVHYIRSRSRLTKRTEYWIYNDQNGDYYIEDVDFIGKRD